MSTTVSLSDRTVGELAAEMPASIRIFEAWKIDYCCSRLTSLPEACSAAGKTIDEFASALEASAVAPSGVAHDWPAESLIGIAEHIVTSYHRYTRDELQTLIPLAEKVRSVHGERRPELGEVASLVHALNDDMLPHMLKEEQVLFPYVEQLQKAADDGTLPPMPFFGTVRNPVKMMMLEHDRVGELLATLRTVTESYALPEGACFSYRELYRRLEELESLTHQHIHIENNVYFPRAVALEEEMGNIARFGDASGSSCCGGH